MVDFINKDSIVHSEGRGSQQVLRLDTIAKEQIGQEYDSIFNDQDVLHTQRSEFSINSLKLTGQDSLNNKSPFQRVESGGLSIQMQISEKYRQ